ncbi:Transient receptor putative cation channel sub V member 6 [Chytriomyces hyalinus]|nr:Transient receptor putative cation channel sub V member 6 [Chytriomyces hyalinus]
MEGLLLSPVRLETQAEYARDGNLWQAVWAGNFDQVQQYSQEPFNFGDSGIPDALANKSCLRGDLERGPEGETILHIAIIAKHVKITRWIVSTFPGLVNETYTGARYLGETALHIAVVVNKEPDDTVKFLVDSGASVNGPHAAGTEFLKESDQGSIYFGSTVLHFAVSNGHSKTVQYLIQHANASLVDVDIYGNNVLHLWAYHGAKDLGLYKFLVDQNRADLRAGRTSVDISKARNKDNLTSFQVGVARGHVNVLEAIKEPLWQFGIVRCYKVPLDDIEPLQPHFTRSPTRKNWLVEEKTLGRVSKSVIEIAAERQDKNIISHPLLDAVIKIKWALYGRTRFIRQLIETALLIVCFTTMISLMPSHPGDRQSYVLSSTNRHPIVRLVFEIASLLGTFIVIGGELGELRVQGLYYFRGLGAEENIVQWLFCVLVWLVPIFRWGFAGTCPAGNESCLMRGRDAENVILGLAAIMGWVYVMTFGKGFANIGPLILIIKKMILEDFVRWLVLYLCLTIGTTCALFLQMQNTPYVRPEIDSKTGIFEGKVETVDIIQPQDWVEFAGAALWTTRFIFMQAFFDHFRMGGIAWFTEAVFIVYGFVVCILLFNVLIASLAETLKKVARESRNVWKVQFALMQIQIDKQLSDAAHRNILTHIGWTEEPTQHQCASRYLIFTERDVIKHDSKTRQSHKKQEIVSMVIARDDGGKQILIHTKNKHWTGWDHDLRRGLSRFMSLDVRGASKQKHGALWDGHHWTLKSRKGTKMFEVQKSMRNKAAVALGMHPDENLEDYSVGL